MCFYMKDAIKGFLAGILISLGCVVYTMSTNKIVGSFLFSFGLFTILHLKLNLYTGKIGYIVNKFSWSYIKELLLTLFGNILGALFMAIVMNFTRLDLSSIKDIVSIKTSDSIISILILSFFCGILMFLGVELFNVSESFLSKILAVIFAVMVFILSGFEHCVANMFYFFYANSLDNQSILYLLLMIFGNSIGSCFISVLYKLVK